MRSLEEGNRSGKQLLPNQTVGSACRASKSATGLIPIVIYSGTAAIFPQGYFSVIAFIVRKPNRSKNWGQKGFLYPHLSAHFPALILSVRSVQWPQWERCVGSALTSPTGHHYQSWSRPQPLLFFFPTVSPSSSKHGSVNFLCLAVFHAVIIPTLVSSWLSSSFREMWQTYTPLLCHYV